MRFLIVVQILMVGAGICVADKLRIDSCAYAVTEPVELAAFLRNPQSVGADRFQNYTTSRRTSSPQEIATRLGISRHTVYADMRRAGMTFVEEFQKPPTFAAYEKMRSQLALIKKEELMLELRPEFSELHHIHILARKGLSSSVIARVMDLEAGAVSRLLDGNNHEPVGWFRLLVFNQRLMFEEAIVAALHDEGRTPEEIAEHLNRTSKMMGKKDGVTRSPAAVLTRLEQMKSLFAQVVRSDKVIYRPAYGFLKKDGELREDAAIRFVIDHYYKDDEWLAQQLGLTSFYFKLLCEQRGLKRSELGPFSVEDSSELADRQMRIWITDLILDWSLKNPGASIQASNFGSGKGKVGVPYAKAKRVFGTMENLWIAVKDRALERAIPFYLIYLKRVDKPEALREDWRVESIDLVVDWIAAHDGRTPTDEDFGFEGDDKIRLDYARFTGTGVYGPGKSGVKRKNRFFNNAEQAWTYVKIRAQTRGVVCSPFLDTYFQAPSAFVRNQRQHEAPDRLLAWMYAHQRYPNEDDFGEGDGELRLFPPQLYGTGNYRRGQVSYEGRIFDSNKKAREAIRLRRERRQLQGLVPEIPDKTPRRRRGAENPNSSP